MNMKSFTNTVKMISPPGGSFTKEAYKTAWGPCDNPEWVQIANPTLNPIKLKKGERVADMNIGQEWEIQDCNLDPTKEDHQKELFSENQQKAERTIRALVSFGVLQKGIRNKVPISPFEIKNDVASFQGEMEVDRPKAPPVKK